MYRDEYDDHERVSGRRGAFRDRRMRASDADREATADILRRHYADGRLDAQEFDERAERCYAAKTLGELDELFADLPPLATRDREPEHAWPGFHPAWWLAGIVPIVVAFIVICAITGAHFIFPLFLLLFFVFRPFGWWYGGRRGRRGGGTYGSRP